jgi:hypothetical protein
LTPRFELIHDDVVTVSSVFTGAELLRTSMDTVKDICVIVPTVLLTAATVIGVATVISLGSWALL